jgi:hypothetical protein
MPRIRQPDPRESFERNTHELDIDKVKDTVL